MAAMCAIRWATWRVGTWSRAIAPAASANSCYIAPRIGRARRAARRWLPMPGSTTIFLIGSTSIWALKWWIAASTIANLCSAKRTLRSGRGAATQHQGRRARFSSSLLLQFGERERMGALQRGWGGALNHRRVQFGEDFRER